MSLALDDAAGLDRARAMLDQLHQGVAAGLSQIAANREEARRIFRENQDLEALVAANQRAAEMIEASLQATGYLPAGADDTDVVMTRDASLFAKMCALARGHTIRFTPRAGAAA